MHLYLIQFFLRTTDEEVLRYLKIFSFIRVIEMPGIMQEHAVRHFLLSRALTLLYL